jgi:hypothetical protein
MNLSVSSISISENNLEQFQKKDNKIFYDIENNSLTESSDSYENKSRMFAKNIKYKNKKTYSNYNNIKDTMIKGTRRLYVPTKKIKEGNMTSENTDVLSNVENDIRIKKDERRKDKKDRRGRRKTEEEEERSDELNEINDESTMESEDAEMSRTKKSSKKGKKQSKKGKKQSKKISMNSESSLISLSSDGVDTYHQRTMTEKEATKKLGVSSLNMNASQQNDILRTLPEGYSGPVPQSFYQQQQQQPQNKINAIGKALGHGFSDMSMGGNVPPNLPMSDPNLMGSTGQQTSADVMSPMQPMGMGNPIQSMGMSNPMQPMGMANTMPPMGMANPMQTMGMANPMQTMGMGTGSGYLGMQPNMQPSVQSINLNEASLQQTNGVQNFAQALATQSMPTMPTQQGGARNGNKRVLKLKKDFFF